MDKEMRPENFKDYFELQYEEKLIEKVALNIKIIEVRFKLYIGICFIVCNDEFKKNIFRSVLFDVINFFQPDFATFFSGQHSYVVLFLTLSFVVGQ